MHIDGRKIANGSVIKGDLCIIGAGAAGISIAREWIGKGRKVILLESGGFEYEDRIQELGTGSSSGQKYYPLRPSRLRYFGGTTGHWAGMCAPFDPIDFEQRDWIPHSGWPIAGSTLSPYYTRAQEVLQLGPYQYDYSYWKDQYPAFESLSFDPSIFWNKMWHFSPARFGTIYRDDIIKAPNVYLYTYANVVDLQANEQASHIEAAEVKNYTGRQFRIEASQFILACGAIQNARLLLASKQNAPNGLGNQYDQVGRYFMEHLEMGCAEFWPLQKVSSKLYKWPEGNYHHRAELSITEKAQRAHKMLNGTISFSSLAASRHYSSRMNNWQSPDPRKNMDDMFSRFQKAYEEGNKEQSEILKSAYLLSIRIEQAPNPDSRITLSDKKDEFGVPLPHLHWQLTALDKYSVRKIFELIGREIGRADLGRMRMHEFLRDPKDESFPDTTSGGWHHMGTTRMSDNPRTGVVDANCNVFGVGNLYVAGSACYTTSAAPNPTLTIVALSLRLSDHLKLKMDTI